MVRVPVVDGVRPTVERVREAMFSVLGQDLSDIRFLDACAGSGAVSLEAWSRGARVVACEVDRRALVALRAGVAALSADVQIEAGDVRQRLGGLGRFDVAWVDPPWGTDVAAVARAVADVVDDVLIVEWEAGRGLPDALGPLALRRRRGYGRTEVWEYRAGVAGEGSDG